jgi:CHAT domain-containing protein
MFWEPLEPYLKGVKTIYYSPIDELNNMSFSTFVANSVDTTYLMDKYNLQSVMSTAAIITNKTPNINNEPQSIALFGGVQYNLKTQNINNSELIASRSIRGVNQRNKQRDEVSALPFTQNEIDNVSVILQKAKWTILKESNIKATENKIKELESGKNPTILHFATHGFAFPDFVSNSTSTNIFEKAENPMQRSGLLFYGSGDTWQGKRDTVIKYTGEDGVLTAEEVSNLDLTNTKLVVMSACQSGLGAIKGTEGVYGLKRAFKLAGVENMIVSLWPVPDKETMELMNLFYEELVKTKDINESFQSAQKTMRYKYPSNPWAWGGFVLVR